MPIVEIHWCYYNVGMESVIKTNLQHIITLVQEQWIIRNYPHDNVRRKNVAFFLCLSIHVYELQFVFF